MPQKQQNRTPPQQTPPIPPFHSYIVTMQDDEDDDDYICPVCESECTCDNKRSTVTQPPTHATTAPSLKIRLTVPPNLLSTLQTHSKPQEKHKPTTSVSDVDGGASTPFPPIPKKRGRPTKAEAEARKAVAAAALEQEDKSRLPRAAQSAAPAAPKSSSRRTTNHKHTQSYRKRGHHPKTQTNIYHTSSTESDSEGTASDSFHAFAVRFTRYFVSSSLADSSTLSSLPDPGDDSSLEEEEERYVIQEQSAAREKARMRRELLGGESEQPRRIDPHRRNSWETRPPMRSAGLNANGGSTTSSDSESDSDENEDEALDADDEPDGEADGDDAMDGLRHDDLIIDSDDEEFDADIFFASLSDSEVSVSVFDHVFEAHIEEDDFSEDGSADKMGVIPADEAAAAGLLSPLARLGTLDSATILVTRDWNGQPIFANDSMVPMGLLDIDFELSVVAQHKASTQPADIVTSCGDDDEEMWMQTDEEGSSEQGDTTDDDRTPLRGVQTPSGVVLFRFPTPPVSSIDPLSTLSPLVRRKSSSAKKRKLFDKAKKASLPAPKPSEILAKGGTTLFVERQEVTDGVDESESVDEGSSALSSVFRSPSMGEFELPADPRIKHVIVNGENTADIPSPLGAFERSRRGSGSSRGRKRISTRNESPLSAKRQCQTPLSGRSRSTETRQPLISSSRRPSPIPSQPPQPIDLDDVLDSSLLESSPASDLDKDKDAGRYINRWDRVPMGAFRRARDPAGSSNGLQPVMEWAPHQSSAVSDGFCYGSPGGALMRSGPLFTGNTHTHSQAAYNAQYSPIHSANDGDRTPTPATMKNALTFGNTPPETPVAKILSHKQRRKEKRRQQSVPQPIPSLTI